MERQIPIILQTVIGIVNESLVLRRRKTSPSYGSCRCWTILDHQFPMTKFRHPYKNTNIKLDLFSSLIYLPIWYH